jgi:tRNA G46 methylase TrmB
MAAPEVTSDRRLHCGVAVFYRNAYVANLVPSWLPALKGVVPKLEAGTQVADVGCGYGHSTIVMAQAFPRSRFWGHAVSERGDYVFGAQAGEQQLSKVALASGFSQVRRALATPFNLILDVKK